MKQPTGPEGRKKTVIETGYVPPNVADLSNDGPMSTAQTCVVNRPGPTLTFEMLEEMMADAERDRQKMFEQEIEAYLLAGFKIVVNEFVPDGKLAILPKEYGDALERVLKRLRQRNEAQQFVYRNFYANPLFNSNCLS